ncbi:uncharacterized protein LOC113849815 isoform X3 [Abrus precatorius]|uniref:Uncharacterized protein LOC113849815 isoform X3 n=1 Tax=Abrus precatorius TaxID=3816 RepID=A0A8B8JYP1_ABRPR|nr:uncharacterized protein LOC113849815 isoform X3 [Abrus precatorius]
MRALCSRFQPHSITSNAVNFLRSCSGAAVTAFAAASDLAGGVCLAASRNITGFDALWIGDVLHRVHVDAVGSGIGDGPLRRRNRLLYLRLGPFHSLLRHRATVAAVEAFVK